MYRKLLMTMGMYKSPETEEDFAYVRNYRNMIQGELSELFDCELHVHRTSAFLILGEDCRMGKCFPEENTLSDIVLLVNGIIAEWIQQGRIEVAVDETIEIPREKFREILEECKGRYGKGFIKTYREMTTGEFFESVQKYMLELGLILIEKDIVRIRTAVGKIIGRYPKAFLENGERDEEQMADTQSRTFGFLVL